VSPQAHAHLPEGTMPFLDVLLVPAPVDGRSRYQTHLYDKREQPAFQRVRLSRFVARDSNVNEASKRNIFTGQFHRLLRIITSVDNFCLDVAHLVHIALHDLPPAHSITSPLRSPPRLPLPTLAGPVPLMRGGTLSVAGISGEPTSLARYPAHS